MGLIKSAIYSGAAIYGVKTLAKTAEQHHHNNQMVQQQQQQMQFQQQQQRQSDVSPSRGRSGSPVYYEDNNAQQRRSIDPQPQQEYWYLNNSNEWCRLPAEYANMQVRGGSPQMPARQQPQQLEFDYPQQQGYYPQQQGYVEEVPEQSSSRGLLSPEMMQQAMAIMAQAKGKKGGRGGKDDNKMSDVMAMFSR
jgi:hypothetical protein